MTWQSTPSAPKEFDPGSAFTCCTFWPVIQRACKYGWEKAVAPKADGKPPSGVKLVAKSTLNTQYVTTGSVTGSTTYVGADVITASSTGTAYHVKNVEKVQKQGSLSQLIDNPMAIGCHLPKVVDLTLATPVSNYTSKVLTAIGDKHLPVFEVQWGKGILKQALDLYCMNPKCKACAANDCYWSYKLQCWVPINRYSLLDNAMQLSMSHPEFSGDKDHHCSFWAVLTGTNVITIPEFGLYECKASFGGPTFGAQYGVPPAYVATINFAINGEPDGFRYISHSHGAVPGVLAYLIWEEF